MPRTRTRLGDFLRHGTLIDPHKPWVMKAKGEPWIHVDKIVKDRFNSEKNIPFTKQLIRHVVRIPGFKALSPKAKQCIAREFFDTVEHDLGEKYSTAGQNLPKRTPFYITVEPLGISSRRFKMSDVAGSLQITPGEEWTRRGWRPIIFKGLKPPISPGEMKIYEESKKKQRAKDVARTSKISSIKALREEMKRSAANSIVKVSYQTKVMIKDSETGFFRPLTKKEQEKYKLEDATKENQYVLGRKGDLLANFVESEPEKEKPKILRP